VKRYFGTDGMRGPENCAPITPEMMWRLGMATGVLLNRHDQAAARRSLVLIGKDTRQSGDTLQDALTSGFAAAGVDVHSLGRLPTPGVAMLTRAMRADMGLMVTASHNPADNGVKLFPRQGYKLDDALEMEIEQLMDGDVDAMAAPAAQRGRVTGHDDAVGRYIEAVRHTVSPDLSLKGLRIVVDCANGAAYQAGPETLRELGADVVGHGIDPDGVNINQACGSMHPDCLARLVIEHRADLGIAFDGDGDRVILADKDGKRIDDDQILARIAVDMIDSGRLRGGAIVSTVMANRGLVDYLLSRGVALHQTPVGDRYVVERMRSNGLNLGGEQSGHFILADHATTGDGLVAALQILSAMIREARPVRDICNLFEPVPQVRADVPIAGANPLGGATLKAIVSDTERELGPKGRVLVRKSGTEPVIRILAEAPDAEAASRAVANLRAAIEEAAAAQAD